MACFLPVTYSSSCSSDSPSSTRVTHLHRTDYSSGYRRRLDRSFCRSAWANTGSLSVQGVRPVNSSRGRRDEDMEDRVELPAGDRSSPFRPHNAHHIHARRKSNVKAPCCNSREHKKSVTFEDNPPAFSGSESVPETVLRTDKHRHPMPEVIAERSEDGKSPRKSAAAEREAGAKGDFRTGASSDLSEARLKAVADARDAYLRAPQEKGATSRDTNKEKDGYCKDRDGHKPSSLAMLMRQGKMKRKTKAGEVVKGEDRLMVRGANPRTGIISPSVMSLSNPTDSSQDEKTQRRVNKKKWRLKGDEWISLDIDQSTPRETPPKGSNAAKSKDSAQSPHDSVSPISGPGASSNEWEDRFVVNMPSAREPNPPTMTAQQILEYQKSMEEVYRAGGRMLDPEALPSPRANTPEGRSTPPQKLEKQPSTTFQRKALRNSSMEAEQRSPVSPPLGPRQYYNADDVGRDRVSPIDDESPRQPPEKHLSIAGEAFLGCKEINGAEKNPDEILVFPTTNDSPYPSIPPSPESKRKSVGKRKSGIQQKRLSSEEKATLHGEKPSPSRNSKPTQCSKQPLTNAPKQSGLNKPAPKSPGKTNIPPATEESPKRPPDSKAASKENRNDDDVFIITPTITRTLIPTTIPTSTTYPSLPRKNVQQIKAPKVDDVVQVPRANPRFCASSQFGWQQQRQMLPGRSDMLFMIPPEVIPMPGMPGIRHRGAVPQSRESLSTMPGFIPMPAMMTTERTIGRTKDEHRFCLCRRCISNNQNRIQSLEKPPIFNESPRNVPNPRFQDVTTTPSPPRERPKSYVRVRTPKIAEIAELDGQQVSASEDSRENEAAIVGTEDSKVDETTNNGISLLSLSLLFDIFLLSVAQLYDFLRRNRIYHHASVVVEKVLEMAGHCFHVSKRVLDAFIVYKRTGSWPKSNSEELALLMRDMGQAGIYFVVLGFVVVILGRAAGYMVLFASWVVWFAKPFGWVFGKIGKVLFV